MKKNNVIFVCTLIAAFFTINSFAIPVIPCPSASTIQSATFFQSLLNTYMFNQGGGYIPNIVMISNADTLNQAENYLATITQPYTTDAEITPIGKTGGYNAVCYYAPYASNPNTHNPVVEWARIIPPQH
jgi:hypothetical protein